jgi:hypothetical protein
MSFKETVRIRDRPTPLGCESTTVGCDFDRTWSSSSLISGRNRGMRIAEQQFWHSEWTRCKVTDQGNMQEGGKGFVGQAGAEREHDENSGVLEGLC